MSRKKTAKAQSRGMGTFVIRATVAALLCLPAALPAFADDAVQHEFTIPAQSLQTALQEFARQSGTQIVFASEVVCSRQGAMNYDAPVLNGRYTSARALQVLLNGTGLTARQLDDRTIEVQPAPAAEFVRTADIQGQ